MSRINMVDGVEGAALANVLSKTLRGISDRLKRIEDDRARPLAFDADAVTKDLGVMAQVVGVVKQHADRLDRSESVLTKAEADRQLVKDLVDAVRSAPAPRFVVPEAAVSVSAPPATVTMDLSQLADVLAVLAESLDRMSRAGEAAAKTHEAVSAGLAEVSEAVLQVGVLVEKNTKVLERLAEQARDRKPAVITIQHSDGTESKVVRG
jgi:hypothetical protein